MKRALLFPLLAALAFAGPAHTDNWAVSQIKYENNGVYQSFFTIRSMYTHQPLECLGRNTQNDGLQTGQSVKIELDNSNGSLLSPPDGKCTPKIGREVWGVVYIDLGRGFDQNGPKQSCRKDGSKFYYHPDGGTLIVLMLYSVTQSVFVYLYTKNFLLVIYGIAPGTLMREAYSDTLAILSATMVTVLAIITYARKKTDDRLLKLIREKEQLAAEDPLTGLHNRRAFMETIEALWLKRTEFAVIFLDLDRFKPLNDEHGHAIGDLVLKTISQRLKRESCLNAVARLGGDEFAAIIEGPWIKDYLQANNETVHRLITAPIETETMNVTVGAFMGYAHALNDAASVGELLHAADKAMMRCKANGGGVVRFDPELDDLGPLSSAPTELFRSALKNDQIIPALQPIVDARSGKVLGHELLARWVNSSLPRDPNPAEFIPIAEKLGLLNEVLRLTLAGAMRHLRFQSGFLAINVSPSQLSASSFLELLKSTARENQFPMERIEIEITEHIAFRNLETNIQTLEAARRLGCTISLDDFGSGYSSLSLLDQLPLDKVKLDRSIQTARYRRDVLQATIRFAKELGFSCCVEGIETEHDARTARLLGSDQMQGYWIGAPEFIYPNVRYLKNAS